MGRIMDIADRLWTGRLATAEQHPWAALQELEELDIGVAFVSSFANVTVFDTAAGLVLVDTGSAFFAGQVRGAIRGWSPRPVHTAVYTHGHVDHVLGMPVFDDEARSRGWPTLRVVAHEAVAPRFDRYRLTAGYNRIINARQFRVPGLVWPTEYRYPDVTYRESLDVEVGGARFALRHGRGETDDHTWIWIPERRIICTGDLFIWASPNCGNPQKVQRYPIEWAHALRAMDALGAELLCPGHGYPIRGADRVHQALTDTATLLESLHDQTVEMMNAGARLDEILHTVRAPSDLLARPYLHPIYDEPESIWRSSPRRRHPGTPASGRSAAACTRGAPTPSARRCHGASTAGPPTRAAARRARTARSVSARRSTSSSRPRRRRRRDARSGLPRG